MGQMTSGSGSGNNPFGPSGSGSFGTPWGIGDTTPGTDVGTPYDPTLQAPQVVQAGQQPPSPETTDPGGQQSASQEPSWLHSVSSILLGKDYNNAAGTMQAEATSGGGGPPMPTESLGPGWIKASTSPQDEGQSQTNLTGTRFFNPRAPQSSRAPTVLPAPGIGTGTAAAAPSVQAPVQTPDQTPAPLSPGPDQTLPAAATVPPQSAPVSGEPPASTAPSTPAPDPNQFTSQGYNQHGYGYGDTTPPAASRTAPSAASGAGATGEEAVGAPAGAGGAGAGGRPNLLRDLLTLNFGQFIYDILSQLGLAPQQNFAGTPQPQGADTSGTQPGAPPEQPTAAQAETQPSSGYATPSGMPPPGQGPPGATTAFGLPIQPGQQPGAAVAQAPTPPSAPQPGAAAAATALSASPGQAASTSPGLQYDPATGWPLPGTSGGATQTAQASPSPGAAAAAIPPGAPTDRPTLGPPGAGFVPIPGSTGGPPSDRPTPGNPQQSQNYIAQNGGYSQTGYGHKRGGYGGFKMNPEMTNRLAAAGQAYERETGQKPKYGLGDRDSETQRFYWEDSNHGRKYAAASPGKSLHQQGLAMDMPDGAFAHWLQQGNAKRFGLGFPLGGRDPFHIQMQDGRGNAYPYVPQVVEANMHTQGQATAPGSATRGPRWASALPSGASAPAATRAVLNNNPGNIKMGPDARQYGATKVDNEGHAIFPNKEAGIRAQADLLTRNYNNKTVEEIGRTYAEDPRWAADVMRIGGFRPNERLNLRDPTTLRRLQEAIWRQEGAEQPTVEEMAAENRRKLPGQLLNLLGRGPAAVAQFGPHAADLTPEDALRNIQRYQNRPADRPRP